MSKSRRVLPSHMKKALDRLDEVIHTVDMIVELIDARAPAATRSALLAQAIGGRKTVVVLTKADLANPATTRRWAAWFQKRGSQTLSFSAQGNRALAREKLLRIARARIRDAKKPGFFRIFIIGIPNIGKSTFINVMAGRKRMHVGARPGITRGIQYLKMDEGIFIADTPGIISLNVGGEEESLKLALVGALQENQSDFEEAAYYLLDRYRIDAPHIAEERYKLSPIDLEGAKFFEELAIKRGFLKKGGVPDMERACRLVADDYFLGRVSGLTLESPEAVEEAEDDD